MAKTQTITFSKTGLTQEYLISVLESVPGFIDFSEYMANREGQYSNSWTESPDTVELVRTWASESDFTAYQTETSSWDSAFRSHLSSSSITVTENIV